jgi:hypothetical protein
MRFAGVPRSVRVTIHPTGAPLTVQCEGAHHVMQFRPTLGAGVHVVVGHAARGALERAVLCRVPRRRHARMLQAQRVGGGRGEPFVVRHELVDVCHLRHRTRTRRRLHSPSDLSSVAHATRVALL